jgi:2-haloacid dehalogenase
MKLPGQLSAEINTFVNRGHEPLNAYYEVNEIPDISGLPGLLGL